MVLTQKAREATLHLAEKAAKEKYAADKATHDNIVDGVIPRTTSLEDKHKEYIELEMKRQM